MPVRVLADACGLYPLTLRVPSPTPAPPARVALQTVVLAGLVESNKATFHAVKSVQPARLYVMQHRLPHKLGCETPHAFSVSQRTAPRHCKRLGKR